MLTSPRRLVLLWLVLMVAVGSCSADVRAPDGAGGSGGSAGRAAPASVGRTSLWEQQGLPAGLREAHRAAVQRHASAEYAVRPAGANRLRATNAAQRFEVDLDGKGVHLEPSEGVGWRMSVEALAVGCEAALAPVAAATPTGDGNRVEYRRGTVTEWYLNGPLGVEQGFTLAEPPGCVGPKVIAFAATGTLVAEHVKVAGRPDEVVWRDAQGEVALRYTDLAVKDATGKALPAWLSVVGDEVRIHVDDAGAAYPVEVDPMLWSFQAQLLAPTAQASGFFGYSVALSTDGSTALVGVPYADYFGAADRGVVFVFVRSGVTWSEQALLLASDGVAGDYFGHSVALSGDGNRALIGDPADDAGDGSVYVFARSGVNWSQESRLTENSGGATSAFGHSVALSEDGVTALVGARGDNVGSNAGQGSAYVFVRPVSTWTQQAKLVASDGAVNDSFGESVALSADGSTALIGTVGDNIGSTVDQGSAYAFVRVGTTWSQQAKLVAGDGAANDYFGSAVALSSDGSTALIAAASNDVGANNDQGSAYVFARSGTTWSPQAQLLAADGLTSDFFGRSVALSSDGDTALIGAYYHNGFRGSAYVFARSGTSWSEQEQLVAPDATPGDMFGWSLALSRDGSTIVVGAYQDDVDSKTAAGSVYVFVGPCAGVVCTPSDQCHTAGTCNATTGLCSNPNKVDGTACDDGDPATGADVCTAGVCAGHDLCVGVTCFALSQCHDVGTCDPGTGICSTPTKPNSTACDDNNPCTLTDACQSGLCLGSNPVVCTASDQCHAAGACNPATGMCSNPNKANGSSCTDGDACTMFDSCQAGVCVSGTPKTCAPIDACHDAGTCNPANGFCSNPNKSDGTACSDGNACTQTDTCQAGACTGASPVVCAPPDQCHQAGTCNAATGTCSYANKPSGTACDDGDACTQVDTCQAGVCVGGTPVVCAPPDQCHAAGTCNPATGACSNPTKADGAACNDGDACTQTDTCQSGTCVGNNPKMCAASDQCHAAGTCDPATGACSNPSKPDGSACSDGDTCTQTDTCQAGACVGANPLTCTASDQCHAATCNPTTGACSNAPLPNGTACNDGNACTTGDVCTTGVCGGAAYTCTPTSCQASSTCDGNGGCTIVDKGAGVACPDDGNACTSDACDGAGACQHPTKTEGTSCGAGQVCATGTCASGCFIGGVLHAAGTVNPANPCLVCTPSTSTTTWSNGADGTSCDDGNACTSGDVCVVGTCGGTAYACTPTSCQASSTCDGNGGCTVVDKPSGAACPDDGNPCSSDTCDGAGTCAHPTLADGTTCGSGVLCQGGSCGPKCQIGGQFYASGTINPANACEQCSPALSTTAWSSRADGTICDDGNACTKNDACNAGVCGGTTYTCTPGICDASSTCDGNGGCTVIHNGSGVACPDDGNPCTADACDGAGNCAHATLADGTSCAPGQVCEGGACATQCFIGGVLVAAGTPNPANPCEICAPGTATTSWTHSADGTACDDGDACTQTDTCQAGSCTGGNPTVCTASDACHDIGTCDPATGLCSDPVKADGASCDDGDACTQTDTCASGACVGGNPKSCAAIDECHVDGACDKGTGDCSTPAKSDGEPCSNGTCQSGVCTGSPDGGMGGSGGATSTGGSGGAMEIGGSGPGSNGKTPDQKGGCGCRLAGDEDGSQGGLMGLVGLMLVAGASRRRGRSRRRVA